MLGKDFILHAILQGLHGGMSTSEVSNWLGIDEEIVLYIEHAETNQEKWGKVITGQDVVDIYRGGLTFSEIAWIKGVTKEAIRLTVDSTIGSGKAEAKKESSKKRKEVRSVILYKVIVGEVEKLGKEVAMEQSGYSKSMFNQLYRESVKWKEAQEELEKGKQDEGTVTME